MCDNFKCLSSQVGMYAGLFHPCFFAFIAISISILIFPNIIFTLVLILLIAKVKCGYFMGKKLHSLPSYVFLHAYVGDLSQKHIFHKKGKAKKVQVTEHLHTKLLPV